METNIYAISYKLRRELQRRILFCIGLFFLFFVIVSLILNFIIFPIANKSDSMSPDIPAGSYEFVSPLLKNPHRGDVVLLKNYESESQNLFSKLIGTFANFISFGKWQPFGTKELGTRPVLRRVVGVPGDTLYIDRYVVFIKPADQNHFLTEFEITNSKYNAKILVPPANWEVDFGAKASIQEITLSSDEFFVLGDDRLSASDSRMWGPVKQKAIVGKCLFLYFPFNKFKIF